MAREKIAPDLLCQHVNDDEATEEYPSCICMQGVDLDGRWVVRVRRGVAYLAYEESPVIPF